MPKTYYLRLLVSSRPTMPASVIRWWMYQFFDAMDQDLGGDMYHADRIQCGVTWLRATKKMEENDNCPAHCGRPPCVAGSPAHGYDENNSLWYSLSRARHLILDENRWGDPGNEPLETLREALSGTCEALWDKTRYTTEDGAATALWLFSDAGRGDYDCTEFLDEETLARLPDTIVLFAQRDALRESPIYRQLARAMVPGGGKRLLCFDWGDIRNTLASPKNPNGRPYREMELFERELMASVKMFLQENEDRFD